MTYDCNKWNTSLLICKKYKLHLQKKAKFSRLKRPLVEVLPYARIFFEPSCTLFEFAISFGSNLLSTTSLRRFHLLLHTFSFLFIFVSSFLFVNSIVFESLLQKSICLSVVLKQLAQFYRIILDNLDTPLTLTILCVCVLCFTFFQTLLKPYISKSDSFTAKTFNYFAICHLHLNFNRSFFLIAKVFVLFLFVCFFSFFSVQQIFSPTFSRNCPVRLFGCLLLVLIFQVIHCLLVLGLFFFFFGFDQHFFFVSFSAFVAVIAVFISFFLSFQLN